MIISYTSSSGHRRDTTRLIGCWVALERLTKAQEVKTFSAPLLGLTTASAGTDESASPRAPSHETREREMAKRLIKLKYCRAATVIGTVATAVAVVGAGHKWH
jgi:hypothetical protein